MIAQLGATYDLATRDRQFAVMFGFPKVFTALTEIPSDAVSDDVKAELISILNAVLNQFLEEDARSYERNGFINWGATPLSSGWRNLKKHDMMLTEDGSIAVKPAVNNVFGRMLFEYGSLKFSVLRMIAQGPYGPGARSRYHTVLSKMLDSMSRHILDKVPEGEETKHIFYTPGDSLGINQNQEIVTIMAAIYKGVP